MTVLYQAILTGYLYSSEVFAISHFFFPFHLTLFLMNSPGFIKWKVLKYGTF